MHRPAILCVVSLLVGFCGSSSLAGPYYSVTPIESPTFSLVGAAGINDSGVVAGEIDTSDGLSRFPFLYDSRQGGTVTLPTVTSPSGQNPGSYNGYSGSFISINNQGEAILGTNGSLGPVYSTYENGQITPLPSGLWATGLNDHGDIVGTMPAGQNNGFTDYHAFLYSGGKVQDLGTPPGTTAITAAAINNAGQIAVNASNNQAYLLDGQKWTALGTLGGATSDALAINARGDIVGQSDTATAGVSHAFLASAGGRMIDLGTLPGDKTSAAVGINNSGAIVGYSYVANMSGAYHAWLYENGVMTNLNQLVAPGSGWNVFLAVAVNDAGQILAYAENRFGNSDSLLLLNPPGMAPAAAPVYPALPVPEPPSQAIFALICLGLGCTRVCRLRLAIHGPERKAAA